MADMVDVGHPRPSQGVPPQGAPSAAPSHLQRTNAIDGIRRTPEERLERRGGTEERLWWSSRMEHVKQIALPAVGRGGLLFDAFRKAAATALSSGTCGVYTMPPRIPPISSAGSTLVVRMLSMLPRAAMIAKSVVLLLMNLMPVNVGIGGGDTASASTSSLIGKLEL